MALPPAPWDVVIGRTPAGDTVILPGPQGIPGAPGAAGATGATGPVAAPLAKYLLDEADAGLINGIVIHRALGPDRVPTAPNAMDDEMLNASTGYNPLLWNNFSAGSETYGFDPFGGLVITTANDSTIRGIEQPFDPTSITWGFKTKISLGFPGAASNSHAGLMLRQASNGYIRIFTIGMASGAQQLNVFEFDNTGTYHGTLATSNILDHVPTQWVYLRVRGGPGVAPSHYEFSLNGISWRSILDVGAYPDAIERVGLIVYQGDSNVGPVYFQHFRRYL